MPSFSIVIPNLNGENYLSKCLHSISQAIYSSPTNKYEIILVDNASTDNSLNLFANTISPNISSRIILLSKNTGFAYAVNQGIIAAKNDYVVVCNNDLTLKKSWFNQISKSIISHPDIACLCGTVLSSDGRKIESQGIDFEYSGKCNLINHHRLYTKKLHLQKPKLVWGSTAAIVVYKKDIIEKLGLFDSNYFAYLEDVDLSFRLHQNHYQTLLIPTAISTHLGGGTSNRYKNMRPWYTFRNWFYFILKNYKPSQIIKNFPQIIIERLRNLSYLFRSITNKI